MLLLMQWEQAIDVKELVDFGTLNLDLLILWNILLLLGNFLEKLAGSFSLFLIMRFIKVRDHVFDYLNLRVIQLFYVSILVLLSLGLRTNQVTLLFGSAYS